MNELKKYLLKFDDKSPRRKEKERLAKKLGVSPSTIAYWMHDSASLPSATKCIQLENATNGEVEAKKMRPDVFDCV
jgi:DNA-binding transcriptional regulator YdaS (Cro superfamily)